ncbi:MAG: hypothetical protein ACKOBC_01800 [Hyphomicrobiales bacterium]
MVDYYALISPTIEPLAGASPEERQVVYRRLVDMLDQQLRAAEPPRSDKEILREKIELESAIRRVERHVLARQKPKPAPSEPPKPITPENSEALLTPNEIPVQAPIRKDILGLSRFATSSGEASARPEKDNSSDVTTRAASFEPKEDEPPLIADQDSSPEAFLDVVAENTALPEGETLLDDGASDNDTLSDEKNSDEISLTSASVLDEVPVQPLAPREFFTRPLPSSPIETTARDEIDQSEEAPSLPKALDADYLQKGDELIEDDHQATDDSETEIDTRNEFEESQPQSSIAPLPVPEPRAFTPTTGIILAQQKPENTRYKGLILRLLILFFVLLALMAAVAGVAEFLNRNSANEIATKTTTDTADAISSPTKFTDRLPAEPDEPQVNASTQTGATPADQNAASASPLVTRALFIEEQAGGIGEAKKTEGRVSWKLNTLTSSTTGAADLGVRATIDLTDAGLTASLLFRKNRDLTSANAYLIEVNFQSVGEAPNGKIRDISLPELRPDKKTRGVALAGIPVPVSDNVFLIGLNALPADIKRNIELIQKQNWFFIQVRFATGKRALLLFEKGKTGDRVFEDAIQAWK